jgi:hypothetical protein
MFYIRSKTNKYYQSYCKRCDKEARNKLYFKDRTRKIIKHNMKYSQEYRAWQNMKNRCYNKNTKEYKHYGGRGISVCPLWKKSFINFYKDIGKKPYPNYTLDRINNDGNYEPSNCRWVSMSIQQRNQRKRENKTSLYYGVNNQKGTYVARIRVMNKSIYLGRYKDEDIAAQAYDLAAHLYLKDRRYRNKKIMEDLGYVNS